MSTFFVMFLVVVFDFDASVGTDVDFIDDVVVIFFRLCAWFCFCQTMFGPSSFSLCFLWLKRDLNYGI